jgi:hypothetical protein
MANDFSKEERVAFETLLEGFEDQLVLSKHVSVYNTDMQEMERSGDVIWRPQPYVSQSFDGEDQTANFKENAQLSVPATIGFAKAVPWVLTARELRDALQEGRLGDAAKQKLASDINRALLDVSTLQGTLVVKRTVAATGFDDVALCEAIMNEQGIPSFERTLALSTRDYNGMASNLASRANMQGKPTNAYEQAYVGQIASFDTFKMDYARRLAAAAGGAGITIATTAAGGNVYVPKATSVATTGEKNNVDNRFQNVVVSSTTNVAAGDCFTIATVDAVHHITKQDTGQLKTFRVISITDATHMVICPPLITGQGGTDAELQYQNCVVGTPAANSAIVWLNTTLAAGNPFWQKDALELLPAQYSVPTDGGPAILKGTTSNGVPIVMQKFYDINTMKTKFRVDILFGVVNKQPEMSGVILFGQS